MEADAAGFFAAFPLRDFADFGAGFAFAGFAGFTFFVFAFAFFAGFAAFGFAALAAALCAFIATSAAKAALAISASSKIALPFDVEKRAFIAGILRIAGGIFRPAIVFGTAFAFAFAFAIAFTPCRSAWRKRQRGSKRVTVQSYNRE